MWDGILFGAGVAAINGLIAWILLRWSMAQGNAAFMAGILGGVLVRLIFVGLASVIIFKFTAVDMVAYLISLVALFLLFQGVEIALLLRRVDKKNGQN